MEFLRFGSSIPGAYWGCCAMDIIQNMKVSPKQKYAVAIINGDSGHPLSRSSEQLYYGTTYEEVFRARMVAGTFSGRAMPDHGFLAILTSDQIDHGVGKEWLKILEGEGFEFIRTVDNSVYSGDGLKTAQSDSVSCHENYLFGLFRNIGTGGVRNQLKNPEGFSSKVPSAVDMLDPTEQKALQKAQEAYHLDRYNKNKAAFKQYTLKELYAAGLTDHDIAEAGTQMRGAIVNPRYQEMRANRALHSPQIKITSDAAKGTKLAKAVGSDPFAFDTVSAVA